MIVLQVLDHDEMEFPFETTTLFKGLEEMGELVVEPRALREAYWRNAQTLAVSQDTATSCTWTMCRWIRVCRWM